MTLVVTRLGLAHGLVWSRIPISGGSGPPLDPAFIVTESEANITTEDGTDLVTES